jgi:hypothetical protein
MLGLVFILLFFSIYYVKRHSIADAAVNLYLPFFLLFPDFYALRIPHLPDLDFPTAALMPIVAAIVIRRWKQWKFQRTDLWLAIFFGGAYYSETSHSGAANAGLLLFRGLAEGVMPYILGKMVIESDGIRERFARRYVHIVFFIAVLSIWEFRMGRDLFTWAGGTLFGVAAWLSQPRAGFIRIAGPFTGAIMAGSMFSIALLFSLWLGVLDKSRGNEPRIFGIRRSVILSMGAAGGLYMTLSRGPEIGTIFGYLLARIGNAKNMRRTAIITALVIVVAGSIGYFKAKAYTEGDIFSAKTQEQENAIYRRILLESYKPVIEQGGLFGYGVVEKPVVAGQTSIDNAYLYFEITQGKLGLWVFMLIGFEAVLACYQATRRSVLRSDIFFCLSLGGGIAGLMLSLTSVYLGGPMYPLFFLLLGWSQSLRQTQTASVLVPQPVNTRFAFRRVIA